MSFRHAGRAEHYTVLFVSTYIVRLLSDVMNVAITGLDTAEKNSFLESKQSPLQLRQYIAITKISCGIRHVLLIGSFSPQESKLFSFGVGNHGELGLGPLGRN